MWKRGVKGKLGSFPPRPVVGEGETSGETPPQRRGREEKRRDEKRKRREAKSEEKGKQSEERREKNKKREEEGRI